MSMTPPLEDKESVLRMRAVSLLVLLCCSLLEGQSVSENDITLSHYEGRENQIQAENPRTEPPATTSTQQSCQPDLHSVLREMSAMLAELRVEQRYTTTAVNNMETRLRASESQTEELKKKNEEKLKDLKTSFENQVENLKKENEAQSVNQSNMEVRFGTELEELRVKNDDFGDQVESLKKENRERKVVFSVGLLGADGANTGPYSTYVTLVYKHIFTNICNAYNPATGYFTAPVRGVYQFTFSARATGGRSVGVSLHKNGYHIAGAYSSQSQGTVSASNGVSLLLDVGDVVCLKLRTNDWIFDDWFHSSTFSGQMLFSV